MSPIEGLEQAAGVFGELARFDCADPMRLHDVLEAMYDLCSAIASAERQGHSADDIRCRLAAARDIFGRSPFVRRLQSWPRGYPGDFETIEYIMASQNCAPIETLEYWIEYASLTLPIAQQHRNKVATQAALIEECIRDAPMPPHILVVAAGSAPDVRQAAGLIRERECVIVLNDSDEEALRYAIARLPDLGDRIHTAPGDILTSIKRLAGFGSFDLVVAGGLFDYLPDRHAKFLISNVVKRLLRNGGNFFLTNIVRPNPYRVLIEYMGDWRLIERSEEDLRSLIVTAIGDAARVELGRDETGLAVLALLKKCSD